MPYIKAVARNFILEDKGLFMFVDWLKTIPVEERKGFVAYITEYIAKYAFEQNYFGRSTGLDAVRSAFQELDEDLTEYEQEKREENGEV